MSACCACRGAALPPDAFSLINWLRQPHSVLLAEVLHWPRKKEAGTETSSSGVTPTRSGSWAADVETFAGPALMLVDDDEAVKRWA